MSFHSVPGVSVAVIDEGKVAWAKGYGVLAANGNKKVDADTLFQAASLSKVVTAAAVLRLVEKGELSLDADVNSLARSWQLPEAEIAKRKAVTLRMLLSHSGGVSVHGFIGYRPGAPLPGLLQILNGESPSNSPPIRIEQEPGTKTIYSGGGYTIVQQILIDRCQQGFGATLDEQVLTPCKMVRSRFDQPLSPSHAMNAASAHLEKTVVPGGAFVYPELAAAGMWSTPTDIASFLTRIVASANGTDPYLSKTLAMEMTTPVTLAGRSRGEFGIGPQVHGVGRELYLSHSGGNVGFQCLAVIYSHSRSGAVVMTNSSTGSRLASEIMAAVADGYHWPGTDFRPQSKAVHAIDAATLQSLSGEYVIADNQTPVTLRAADGALLFKMLNRPEEKFVAESADKFFSLTSEKNLCVERGADGLWYVSVRANGTELFKLKGARSSR